MNIGSRPYHSYLAPTKALLHGPNMWKSKPKKSQNLVGFKKAIGNRWGLVPARILWLLHGITHSLFSTWCSFLVRNFLSSLIFSFWSRWIYGGKFSNIAWLLISMISSFPGLTASNAFVSYQRLQFYVSQNEESVLSVNRSSDTPSSEAYNSSKMSFVKMKKKTQGLESALKISYFV